MHSISQAPPLSNKLLACLMDAVLLVNQQRTLKTMLQQVVDLSCSLLHVDYAAVGLYSTGDQFHSFAYSGIPPKTAEHMTHDPVELGLLATMGEENEKRPFSIPRITDDPHTIAFPLVAHGNAVGCLYLTRKRNESFSEQTQELAVRFAAHVAIALHDKQLLQTVQEEQQAMIIQNGRLRDLSNQLLAIPSLLDLTITMKAICTIARQVVDGIYGAVLVMDKNRLENFVEDKTQNTITLPSWLETLRKLKNDVHLPMQMTTQLPDAGFTENTLFIPILTEDQCIGHFFLAKAMDDNQFSEDDYELIEILAARTAVIIQNEHAYQEVSRLAITEERARIGMDLHDGVIQSIYAVGLILESARMSAPEGADESDQLLAKAIDELNDTIRDIRNLILDLRPHRFDGNLKQALARLVREFQANTMVSVSADIAGTLADALSADVSLAIFLTTQEALANVARHARATNVILSAKRVDEKVILHITDNGRGFDMETLNQTTVGHGLSNMRSRTEELHGELEIKSVVGEGTAVSLALPCP